VDPEVDHGFGVAGFVKRYEVSGAPDRYGGCPDEFPELGDAAYHQFPAGLFGQQDKPGAKELVEQGCAAIKHEWPAGQHPDWQRPNAHQKAKHWYLAGSDVPEGLENALRTGPNPCGVHLGDVICREQRIQRHVSVIPRRPRHTTMVTFCQEADGVNVVASEDDIAHSVGIFLIDRKGFERAILTGDPASLAQDVGALASS
jgi:hypothetical protein